MLEITQTEYNNIHSNYKHTLKSGERTILRLVNGSTTLLVEGVGFVIKG